MPARDTSLRSQLYAPHQGACSGRSGGIHTSRRALTAVGSPRGAVQAHGCLVDVVLDEERLLDRRLRARHVLADAGLRVGDGAGEELVLRGLVVLLLAGPDLGARRLEGARVREGEREGALARELV